jgi:hypothetical protein
MAEVVALRYIASKKSGVPGMRTGRLAPVLTYQTGSDAPLTSPFPAGTYGDAPAAGARPTFCVETDEALRAFPQEATVQLQLLAETNCKEIFGKQLSSATIASRFTPLLSSSGLLRIKLRTEGAKATRFWDQNRDQLLGLPELGHMKLGLQIQLGYVWSRADGHWGVGVEAANIQLLEAVQGTSEVACPF